MAKIKNRSAGAMMPLPEPEQAVPNPGAKNQSASGYPAFWPEYLFL